MVEDSAMVIVCAIDHGWHRGGEDLQGEGKIKI